MARVDGQAYLWMGQPGIPNVSITHATQKSLQVSSASVLYVDRVLSRAQLTSTQSVFVMTAGPVDLTITFLSPVEVM